MKFEHLQGSIVAMVTPFRQDGSVNFDMLTELLERQIAAGTDGILTLGTTGEYSTMSHEEDAAVVEHTIRVVDGRVPVMVGSGSNCTVTQIEKSRLYQSMGADALLLISPYYNKANAEGMYRHFAETADAVDIPCILYNVPGRTGCSIPVSVVERLARHPNIAGIKEASGDMSYAMKIARCVGPDFALYSGNDDITVPLIQKYADDVVTVSDLEISEAVLLLMERCKQIVEPSGAAPVAAVLKGKVDVKGKNVVCLLSGGNIDVSFIQCIIEQGLVARSRRLRFTVTLLDRPGSLGKLLNDIAALGANILSVEHDRLTAGLNPNEIDVHVSCEVGDKAHGDRVRSQLIQSGYHVKID